MTEWTKTILFVAAAGVSVGLAAAAQTLSRPSAPKEFERVGTEFYPEFQDPTKARSLQVVSYDEDTSVIKDFDVTWGKEGWTISPYNYPADGQEQLKKTAASVIGIARGGLESRRETDQERFGVIDPLSDDATKLKGRGRRVTLKDDKGNVLADYILGKPVDGQEGYFYVRAPKEKEIYRAKVSLNLSTKFADWIESDLLKLSSSDLRKIEILDYSVDEDKGSIKGRDRSVLTRAEDFGPWKLEGLNEAAEQVNTAEVNKITRVLDDLKITGVRPKPPGLNPDLSLDPNVIKNQISLQLLAESLANKGFLLLQNRQGEFQLVAKEGQLIATANDGVAYDLYFGDQFTGSQFELEFGDAKNAEKPKHLGKGEQKKNEKGRYLLVTARFEPASLGEAPKAPAEPAPPAENASEEDKKKAADAAKKATEGYEVAKKAYDQKAAAAKKRVDDLNARFKKWYYVISAESFQDLRLSRAALVEPKKEEPKPGAGLPGMTLPGAGAATPGAGTPPAGAPPAGAPPAGPDAAPEVPAEAPKPEPSAPSEEAAKPPADGADAAKEGATPPDVGTPPGEVPAEPKPQ